jgi:hypothetical protein
MITQCRNSSANSRYTGNLGFVLLHTKNHVLKYMLVIRVYQFFNDDDDGNCSNIITVIEII